MTTVKWRKSSYSGNDASECVEIADSQFPHLTPVRDSKDPSGPALVFPAASFTAFLADLKRGTLS
ncbi:DUF397 domain-containing protein [Kitasatospora sp. NPDC006697]|uniref:DUF397 domain-containing protein n=1 Tax=Kitasatospora sp. NPDC006697 TaxID=3364020 RepID=UPI0036BFBB6C